MDGLTQTEVDLSQFPTKEEILSWVKKFEPERITKTAVCGMKAYEFLLPFGKLLFHNILKYSCGNIDMYIIRNINCGENELFIIGDA